MWVRIPSFTPYAAIAQLVESATDNRVVTGSSPVRSTSGIITVLIISTRSQSARPRRARAAQRQKKIVITVETTLAFLVLYPRLAQSVRAHDLLV